MSFFQLNDQPKSRPGNSCAPYRNIDCQSLLELTDAPAGWLRTIDKSTKWLMKFAVLYHGHVYIFKNDLSACQQNILSLHGYDSCRIERLIEMNEREGLYIFKIIPAANVTRKSRYFASASERELYFWIDNFSREMQKAKVQIYTQRMQEDTNYNIMNSNIALSSMHKRNKELSMKCGIEPNNEKDKMNNLYMHVTGVNEETTTDTIYYFFENKKRSGFGNVYFVDHFSKKESVIFFRSDKVITEFGKTSFLIDNAKVTVVKKSSSFNDRVLVQNIHKSTTKDGLKCFVKAQTGKDLQSILFDKTGMAILDFGNAIDFTAVEQACEKETLDSNSLKIKPIKSSKKILVKGYENRSTDDLLFYFDNTRQSGGEDVEEVTKLDDETHLVNFMFSHCIIDVCKRKHFLKAKTLKVQIYYQCMDRSDKLDFLTERKTASTKLLNRHEHYNYQSGRTAGVAKKRKRRTSDTGQKSNSPSYCLPYTVKNCEREWILDNFICKTENENKKFRKGFRLPRCVLTWKNKAKRMKKAGRPQFHRASFTRRNKGRKKGEITDINKISNPEIREDQASVNTEGKTTLLNASKEKSEENGNLEQDVTSLVKSLSKAEENFLVFYHLCVLEACLPVKLYFSRKVPESTLAAHLESYIKDLKFSRWKCTNDQLDLLFPAVPSNVSSTSFDFNLLYKLIRNTLPLLSSPTRGWGSKPLPGDITELDDIERIRYNRTLLANITEFKLTNSVFKHLVNDLSQAITRLSFETITIDICRFKKKCNQQGHKEISENIRTDIETIKDEMNTLHRDMFEGKDSISKLQERLKEKADQRIAFYGPKKIADVQQATEVIEDGSPITNGFRYQQKEDTNAQKAHSKINSNCNEHIRTVPMNFMKVKTDSDICGPYVPILIEHHTFDIPLGAKKREVRDCTTLPGGGWIVSDYKNSELLMNDLGIRIKLPKPMFVTYIDGNVAVSCVNGNKIRYFDINTRKIKKEIKTVETVLGMTNTRAGLLVRAGNAGCRFISSGQSDEIIPINGDNMPYIAVWEDNIFLTNWKSHEINCYNTLGVLQWSFTNENMRSPNGVSTDKEGNVFVVGTYSHNILILSKNYKETNKYWFEDAKMRYPIAIDYDQSSDKLMVCNMKGTVKVFDVAPAVT